MRINKCDICKKSIKKIEDKINITVGLFSNCFDICRDCAKPVLKFLDNKKLIKKNDRRKK